MGSSRLIRMVASAAIAILSPTTNALAIVAGSPDAVREYAFVVVLWIQHADLSSDWCTGSVIDDHTVITAAHCVLGGYGRALPDYRARALGVSRSATQSGVSGLPSAFLSSRRGSAGRVYIKSAYVNPLYLSGLTRNQTIDLISPFDVAILKTADPIRKFTTAKFADIPQTAGLRSGSKGPEDVLKPVDYKRVASQTLDQIKSRLKKLVSADALEAQVAGFGCRDEDARECRSRSRLPINYLSFFAKLGVFRNGKCVDSVDHMSIMSSQNSCYIPTKESEDGKDVVPKNFSNQFSNAAVGDSGGPVSIGSGPGMPSWFGNIETGPPQEVVAVTSWGDPTSVSMNTNLLPNTEFLKAALTENPSLKPVLYNPLPSVKETPLRAYQLSTLRGLRMAPRVDVRLGVGDGIIAYQSDTCVWLFTEGRNIPSGSIPDTTEYQRFSTCLGDFGPLTGLGFALFYNAMGKTKITEGADVATLLDAAGNAIATFNLITPKIKTREENESSWELNNFSDDKSRSQDNTLLEDAALGDAFLFWEVFSGGVGPFNDNGDSLPTMYAHRINYYGRILDHSGVIADKRAFEARWPTRSYRVRPSSISVRCKNKSCEVSGQLDWAVESIKRRAKNQGISSFSLEIDKYGKISAEDLVPLR